jgi:putative peptide zinc metalloprotease protein
MNILEAFDQGLPEISATSRKGYPKLDPSVIFREHMHHGEPLTFVKVPGGDNYVRLTRPQWALLQLFDGVRSYQEVADLMPERAGIAFTEEEAREFAALIEDKTELFYKTPLEKNITLKQKLGAHRHKRRIAFKDVSDIRLHRWPNADAYITRLHPYVSWIYTRWFTILTVLGFMAMFAMWAGKFGEIWNDSFEFYNFAAKTAWDLFEFWILFGVMAFCHETAHGMTCKHYGGDVEGIEFLLMYFSPTFVCDCSQIWIVGDRRDRTYTIIAGLWFDLILCVFATTVWWLTAPGVWVHQFAYKVMMVTGLAVTLLNLNPLIKLDGYYLFSELVQEVDMYELSRAYLSNWVRKNVYQLPVDVEFLPKRRRVLYLVYATISCTYGYLLLIFVLLFLYHIFRHFSPEYGWVPAVWIGYLMFRGRARKFVRLMKDIYLDKKEILHAWFTPKRLAIYAAGLMLVSFLPLWPDNVECLFVVESAKRAVIRTRVAGVVEQVRVAENDRVEPGQELVLLNNLSIASKVEEAQAKLRVTTARADQARLRYADFGRAEHEREQALEQSEILANELSELSVKTPVSGTVMTPRLNDLRGSYLPAGAEIAQVVDTSALRARLYIPEFGVRDVRVGTSARLHIDGHIQPMTSTLESVGPAASLLDPGLMEKEQLQGLVPPPYYLGWARLPDSSMLREGMTGTAKLFVRRRSLAAMSGRFLRDLIDRRFW